MINDYFFDWQSLLIGIQFLLGLQLIVVAILHFIYQSNATRIPLGFLALILGLWFFKKIFLGYWQDHLLLFLLIGPGKPIFAGSLLLFYYQSYSSKLKRTYVLKQLAIPTIYYAVLIITRFFLTDLFSSSNHLISIFFSICVFIIFWWYFFLTRKELRTQIKQKLIPKAYKKVLLLFYSLYFFLLQVPIWDIFKKLIEAKVLPNSFHLKAAFLYDHIFKYVGEYLSYTYLHLLAYFLFIYALSELVLFKRLFLPRDAIINQNMLKDKKKIDRLMHHFFNEKKLFKNPDLSLASCAKTFDITKKELTDYFKLTQQSVFKDYINKLRVDEWKVLLHNEKFKHYDLVGLAKECGFKSKSTFFRVFKDIEGITPNQFKKEAFK